jgi:hypothetical protein
METHLILCCCSKCKDYEMNELFRTWGEEALLTSNGIIVENSRRYIFIVNVNDKLQSLCGIRIKSYRVCHEYDLDDKTRDCLENIIHLTEGEANGKT